MVGLESAGFPLGQRPAEVARGDDERAPKGIFLSCVRLGRSGYHTPYLNTGR